MELSEKFVARRLGSRMVSYEPIRRAVSAPCVTTGLFKVRYGKNKVAVFNSHCQCKILLQAIRKTCGLAKDAMLDLLSWKEAELQNLPYRDGEYASISIREREVYVLISIIEDENQVNPQYVSLLQDLDKQRPDLVLKLHDLSKPAAKDIRAKWASLGRKGLEVSGVVRPASPPKGLKAVIDANKASGSSKLVGVLAAALRQQREMEPRKNSSRKNQKNKRN